MRTMLLAAALAGAALSGCVGGEDDQDDAGDVGQPPNPFPSEFGLRLTCLDAVADITGCTVRTTEGPANEVSIAVNPTDPLNLIGGSKDYSLGDAEECGGHRVWSGVYVSLDGGATWNHTLFPGYPGNDEGPLAGFPCVSDPVVVFAPDGTAYYSGLAARGPAVDPGSAVPQKGSGIWVARSDDKGLSWSDPVFVATSDGGVVFHDKQWMAAGPDGQLIVTWTAFFGTPDPIPPEVGGMVSTAQILASVSTDQGATWSQPRVVFEADTRTPSTPHAFELDKQFSTPAFDTDGNVYVTWLGFRDAFIYLSRGSPGAGGVYQFGAARAILPAVPLPSPLPNSEFRASTYPVLVADPGTPGVLALVWADNAEGHADILFARSGDGGLTWSSPERVNDDETANDQWMPWAQIDGRGGVHVAWFDRRDDAANKLIDLYYAYAPDGQEFLDDVRVTPQSFDGDLGYHQTGVPFIGDYIGLAVATLETQNADGRIQIEFHVHPFWPDTRTGTSEVYTARLLVRQGRPGQV